MVYRNVSKLLCVEAEGEFSRARLPELWFKWRFALKNVEYKGKRHIYSGWLKTLKLANFSEEHELVVYDVCAKYRLKEDGSWEPRNAISVEPWTKTLKEGIRQQLTFKDTLHIRWSKPKAIFIDEDVNEMPIPGLRIDFDNHQVSFLWKSFLTDFFYEESYVRRQRDVSGLPNDMSPSRADLQSIKALHPNDDDSSASDFFFGFNNVVGQKTATLWANAYKIRLGKAYRQAERPMELPLDLESRLRGLRRLRRLRLLITSSKTRGGWWEEVQKQETEGKYHY